MADETIENGSSSEGEVVNGVPDGHPILVIDDGPPPPPGMITKRQKKPKTKPRASVLEYKTVNEMYGSPLSVIRYHAQRDIDSRSLDGTGRTMAARLWSL